MFTFNHICLFTFSCLILLCNFLPKKKYRTEIHYIQCFLLGLEIWSGVNMLGLAFFGV